MNDPHVETLIYRVEHGPTVNYERAEPLELVEQHFTVRIAANTATFTMKTHFTNAGDALAVVAPFVHAWELSVGLERGPDEFRLVYDRPEIIDRNPSPGSIRGGGLLAASQAMIHARGTLTVLRASYPQPVTEFAVDPDVKSMYDRYIGHLQGSEPLASMAYFCLTVILAGKQRDVAAKKYQISKAIFTRLSQLVTEKGGPEARKASGAQTDFKPYECAWIIAAVKSIIRRKAEVAYSPAQKLSQITFSELPPLRPQSITEGDRS